MKLTFTGLRNFTRFVLASIKFKMLGYKLLALSSQVRERKSICDQCAFNVRGQCLQCECFIKYKVKFLNEKCPLGEW